MNVYSKLWWFFKQEYKKYIVIFTLLGIVSFLNVLPPKLLGEGIDSIASGQITKETLWYYVGTILILSVVIYVFSYVQNYMLYRSGHKLQYMLRGKYLRHLLKMDNYFYEENSTGDLMAVGTHDLFAISMSASNIIASLVESIFYIVFVLGAMFIIVDFKLTFLSVLPLPLVFVIIIKLSPKLRGKFRAYRDSFGKLNQSVLKSVSTVKLTRAYALEQSDIKKLKKYADDVYQKDFNTIKMHSLYGPMFTTIFLSTNLISLSFGFYLVTKQIITPGDVVTFNIYLSMVQWPIVSLGQSINMLKRSEASFDRFYKVMNQEEKIKDEGNYKFDKIKTIEFKDYSFKYTTKETNALENINININGGETIGIVGKIGSGKTTLIKALLRIYESNKGEILINGVEIKNIKLESLRSNIGYVAQDYVVFSKTITENIEFGKTGATDEEISEATYLSNFINDIERMERGFDTVTGEDGVMLSGGQKQRLTLSRALIKKPEVLILDDSLSAVDGKTEELIINNIKREREGKTTIIISHKLSSVSHADKIFVLSDGKLIENGTHEELIKADGWYYEQYEIQRPKELGGMSNE